MSIGSNSVQVQFESPDGFYDTVDIYCQSQEDSTINPEFNLVGKGVNKIACNFLQPGSNNLVGLLTQKGDDLSEAVAFYIQTS